METGSLTIHVKIEDIYKDIGKDVEKRFGTSNYEIDRPLSIRKNKKVIERICWIKSKNIKLFKR